MIKLMKINSSKMYTIEQNHFPDGTLNLNLPDNIPENDLYTIYWYYENDAELFTLIAIKDHYEQSEDVNLVMPYIPHARMDRVKHHTDVFTLKSFAKIINSLNFKNVYVIDAHSNVSLALIDRVVNMSPVSIVGEFIEDDVVLFFPDEGAMKRYSTMFNKPYAFGMKVREWETGKIKSLEVINKEVVKDKNVLIIDDICSKGGTFLHAAKALKEAGAKNIELYISHCENTVLEGDMIKSGLIDHIYTTNSIFTKEDDMITVINI